MTNQTSNPSPEQLNDPEGQQLVQAIHARKELQGTLANTMCNASNYPKRAQAHLLGSDMSHVINKTADAVLAAGYRKPRIIGYVVVGKQSNSMDWDDQLYATEEACIDSLCGPYQDFNRESGTKNYWGNEYKICPVLASEDGQ